MQGLHLLEQSECFAVCGVHGPEGPAAAAPGPARANGDRPLQEGRRWLGGPLDSILRSPHRGGGGAAGCRGSRREPAVPEGGRDRPEGAQGGTSRGRFIDLYEDPAQGAAGPRLPDREPVGDEAGDKAEEVGDEEEYGGGDEDHRDQADPLQAVAYKVKDDEEEGS